MALFPKCGKRAIFLAFTMRTDIDSVTYGRSGSIGFFRYAFRPYRKALDIDKQRTVLDLATIIRNRAVLTSKARRQRIP